ncbi:MAG TPA: tetratricopeptide repeat protein [Candidatus Didemnitutus sp.]|nr:tetratricopeptide repeat protein [Candidatus Didemnitutus sp.]
MQYRALLSRFGALGLLSLILVAGRVALNAQTAAPASTASKSTVPEDLSQPELLKSYLQVSEQLHAAQLAIVTNRLEAEAAARSQAVAFSEKVDTLKSMLAVERERQHAEALRQAEERERQDAEMLRANRTVVIGAAVFGGVGICAMLFSTLFQWRAVNRLTEISTVRPSLPASGASGALLAEAAASADRTVTLSNQRLLSTIERIERRIFELEHTTAQPAPAKETIIGDSGDAPHLSPATEQVIDFNVLLGKGRAFINANRVQEAVDCYDEILKVNADHPEALVKKGAALERLKQDQEALRCYDRAIKADRRMTLAYLCKGGVYNRLARFDEAVACYEQALQVEEETK